MVAPVLEGPEIRSDRLDLHHAYRECERRGFRSLVFKPQRFNRNTIATDLLQTNMGKPSIFKADSESTYRCKAADRSLGVECQVTDGKVSG